MDYSNNISSTYINSHHVLEDTQMKTLCIIPARGGSKRLPNKNIRMFNGVPLIARKVHQALRLKCFADVVVSSDDYDVIRRARLAGAWVPYVRPAYLATDDATTEDVVRHLLEFLECENYTHVVVMQCTSPLVSDEAIKRAMEMCSHGHEIVIGHSYKPSGAFYCANVKRFMAGGPLWAESVSPFQETPADESLDIDTLEEFLVAEEIDRKQRGLQHNGNS